MKSNSGFTEKQLCAIVFLTGIFSAAAQVIYLRELLSIFTGNEFIFSFAMCCWMACTAVGCRGVFFREQHLNSLQMMLLLHQLFFCAGIVLIRVFPLLVQPGEQFSPFLTGMIIFITISPAGYVSGLLFRVCTCNCEGTRGVQMGQCG